MSCVKPCDSLTWQKGRNSLLTPHSGPLKPLSDNLHMLLNVYLELCSIFTAICELFMWDRAPRMFWLLECLWFGGQFCNNLFTTAPVFCGYQKTSLVIWNKFVWWDLCHLLWCRWGGVITVNILIVPLWTQVKLSNIQTVCSVCRGGCEKLTLMTSQGLLCVGACWMVLPMTNKLM